MSPFISKERSKTLLIARNMVRLFENWYPNDSDEESETTMLPVIRQIRPEAEEREAKNEALSTSVPKS